jgi:hypothetical protein
MGMCTVQLMCARGRLSPCAVPASSCGPCIAIERHLMQRPHARHVLL